MRFIFLIAVVFFSCTGRTHFINYDRWKVTDGSEVSSYVRNKPAEVQAVEYIWLLDTNRNGFVRSRPGEVKVIEDAWVRDTNLTNTADTLSMQLARFDKDGQLIYSRVWDHSSLIEFSYSYADEGEVASSTVYKGMKNLQGDTPYFHVKLIRRRVNDYTFVTETTEAGGDNGSKLDTTVFGPDGDVRTTTSFTNKTYHVSFNKITWYRNNRPVKEENTDTYGVSGRIYHYDPRGNLDSISFSDPSEKEVFINNPQGDPVLHYHVRAADTIQLERISYIYDSYDNWLRRLSWKKNLEHRVAILRAHNIDLDHYQLTVRSIRY